MEKQHEKVIAFVDKVINYLPSKIFAERNSNTEQFMQNLVKFSVGCALTAVLFFITYSVVALPFSVSPESLGPMGDFFGGILNPIFAFLGLMALLYTLRLNQKELSQATKQMEKTADAAQLQVIQSEMQLLFDKQIDTIENNLKAVMNIKVDGGAEFQTSLFGVLGMPIKKELSGHEKTTRMEVIFSITLLISELTKLQTLCVNHKNNIGSPLTSSFYAYAYGQLIIVIIMNDFLISKLETDELNRLHSLCDFVAQSQMINDQQRKQFENCQEKLIQILDSN